MNNFTGISAIVLYIAVFFINVFAVLFIIRQVLLMDLKKHIYKKVNHFHSGTVVSNLGGVSIFTSFLLLNAIMGHWFKIGEWHLIIAFASFLFFTGLRDDLVKWKFSTFIALESLALIVIVWMGQLKIDSLCGLLGIYAVPDILGYLLAIIILYITISLAGRLDKVDGLLATVAGFTFLTFGLAFALLNLHGYAILCFGMVGSLFGYLKFQSQKCKIVIGKNGSLLIGFLLGFMSLYLFKLAIQEHGHNYGDLSNLLINVPIALSFLLFPLFYYLRRMILFTFFGIPWNQNVGFQHFLFSKGIKKGQIAFLMVLVHAILIGLVVVFVYLQININSILGVLFLFSLVFIWLLGNSFSNRILKIE